jgi:hypothetical protein
METEASGISIRGLQITILDPSGNFTEATEAQTETADPYGTPGSVPISSVESTENGLIGKD